MQKLVLESVFEIFILIFSKSFLKTYWELTTTFIWLMGKIECDYFGTGY